MLLLLLICPLKERWRHLAAGAELALFSRNVVFRFYLGRASRAPGFMKSWVEATQYPSSLGKLMPSSEKGKDKLT